MRLRQGKAGRERRVAPETTLYPVEIRQVPDCHLAGLPHRGSYFDISGAYARLTSILQRGA